MNTINSIHLFQSSILKRQYFVIMSIFILIIFGFLVFVIGKINPQEVLEITDFDTHNGKPVIYQKGTGEFVIGIPEYGGTTSSHVKRYFDNRESEDTYLAFHVELMFLDKECQDMYNAAREELNVDEITRVYFDMKDFSLIVHSRAYFHEELQGTTLIPLEYFQRYQRWKYIMDQCLTDGYFDIEKFDSAYQEQEKLYQEVFKEMININDELTLLTYKNQMQYFKDQGIPAIVIKIKPDSREIVRILIFVKSYGQLEKFQPSSELFYAIFPIARNDVIGVVE